MGCQKCNRLCSEIKESAKSKSNRIYSFYLPVYFQNKKRIFYQIESCLFSKEYYNTSVPPQGVGVLKREERDTCRQIKKR